MFINADHKESKFQTLKDVFETRMNDSAINDFESLCKTTENRISVHKT